MHIFNGWETGCLHEIEDECAARIFHSLIFDIFEIYS